jgi:hypothetical protein
MSLKKRQKQLQDELRGPSAPRKRGEKTLDETDPVGCALGDKMDAAQQRAAAAKSYNMADAKMAVEEAFLIAQAAATAQPVRAAVVKPKRWRIPKKKELRFASTPTYIDDAITAEPLLLLTDKSGEPALGREGDDKIVASEEAASEAQERDEQQIEQQMQLDEATTKRPTRATRSTSRSEGTSPSVTPTSRNAACACRRRCSSRSKATARSWTQRARTASEVSSR